MTSFRRDQMRKLPQRRCTSRVNQHKMPWACDPGSPGGRVCQRARRQTPQGSVSVHCTCTPTPKHVCAHFVYLRDRARKRKLPPSVFSNAQQDSLGLQRGDAVPHCHVRWEPGSWSRHCCLAGPALSQARPRCSGTGPSLSCWAKFPPAIVFKMLWWEAPHTVCSLGFSFHVGFVN